MSFWWFAQSFSLPYNLYNLMKEKLSTESYKGVRDFYPEDMAVLRYIFDVWSQTAESFGYEQYDASILEPSILYKSKGAENEEMVNEQTYTFLDRGGREVTLRPEMTPTVARMIAKKRRDLSFPVRWYSIPNLFRYERPQKGRLREHFQLNCDLFGVDDYTADVEMIALASQMLLNFGAEPEMFEIRINNRRIYGSLISTAAQKAGIELTDIQVREIFRLVDRSKKIKDEEFDSILQSIVGENAKREIAKILADDGVKLEMPELVDLFKVVQGLKEIGVTNVKFDRTITRGFDYYTGTIFEIFDVSGENNRSLLGGGRYDNLTALFGGDAIPGVGFGMGDVTMRDFLETHDLLTSSITAPTLAILPTGAELNLEGQRIAQEFRAAGISTSVDISNKKVGKKISDAADAFVTYALVLGEDELKTQNYIVKNLEEKTEMSGTLAELADKIAS